MRSPVYCCLGENLRCTEIDVCIVSTAADMATSNKQSHKAKSDGQRQLSTVAYYVLLYKAAEPNLRFNASQLS
jgi:hypothetical protein